MWLTGGTPSTSAGQTLTRISLCHISPDRWVPHVSFAVRCVQFQISVICYSLAAKVVVFCDFWQNHHFCRKFQKTTTSSASE